ncbi:Sulfotransferase family protein [Rhodospirillales bacterium URHD0017]|nr:Sulfotransferase family protein [Rhodospirillales bacterium URHD0017]
MIRRREDYSLTERWLHRLVLHSTDIRRLSFDLEAFVLGRTVQPTSDRPVYLCGLARSGTTLLLRLLEQSGEFASLSYRDMPFVMAPNLWAWLSHRWQRRGPAQERVHGDGVLVDYDSPEAFEEVFWRTFDSHLERDLDGYGAEMPSEALLEKFARYRGLVEAVIQRRTGEARRRRYLSKNNNNLMRLEALCKEPGATVLLLFREPIATARSLKRVHERLGAEWDGFTRLYMDWLGHFEFGPGHRPFLFARAYMRDGLSVSSPDYWLDYWTAVHRHILENAAPFQLVDYDLLCRSPIDALDDMRRRVISRNDLRSLAVQVKPLRPEGAPVEFDPELVARARDVHRALQHRRVAETCGAAA